MKVIPVPAFDGLVHQPKAGSESVHQPPKLWLIAQRWGGFHIAQGECLFRRVRCRHDALPHNRVGEVGSLPAIDVESLVGLADPRDAIGEQRQPDRPSPRLEILTRLAHQNTSPIQVTALGRLDALHHLCPGGRKGSRERGLRLKPGTVRLLSFEKVSEALHLNDRKIRISSLEIAKRDALMGLDLLHGRPKMILLHR